MALKRLFILGADDAEMVTIKQLLNQFGERWIQPSADRPAPHYSPADVGLEIDTSNRDHSYATIIDDPTNPPYLRQVYQPVFVEAFPDCHWPKAISPGRWDHKEPLIVIDHHNQRAGEPASIMQVMSLLDCWGKLSPAMQRWVELIAANDTDYIPGMARLGATPEEINRVRALESAVFGITNQQRDQALTCIGYTNCGQHQRHGRLMIINPLPHNKCAAVTDQLHTPQGFPTYDQLLICSAMPGPNPSETVFEVNFFGDGAVCNELKERYGGWGGGSGFGQAGVNAYWGIAGNPGEALITFLKNHPNITAPAGQRRLSQ